MTIGNARVVLKDRIINNGYVSFEDGVITEVGEGSAKGSFIDAKGQLLTPGFVDLHSHGSGNVDFMDCSLEGNLKAAYSYAVHGTTTVLPTTECCAWNYLYEFIDIMKEMRHQNLLSGRDSSGNAVAKMPGIHFEGPYFSMEQRGAQDPRYVQVPTDKEYLKMYNESDGLMLRFSIAPELEGAIECIKFFVSKGIMVSGAHTNATYDDISKAYDAGMKHLTHFYSGMSSITRKGGFRVLGAIESGYLIDDLFVELICDGKHLPPELLKMIFKLKRHDRIHACSDSIRAAGVGDGPSILGSLRDGGPCIVEDGVAKVLDRSCFAGSVATGEDLARVLIKTVGVDESEMTRLLCLQPAQLVGLDKNIGSIEVGKRADLVILDENIKVNAVFVDGKKV